MQALVEQVSISFRVTVPDRIATKAENGHRIIYCAKWIGQDRELVFPKVSTHTVGKTGTQGQHRRFKIDLDTGFRDLKWSTEYVHKARLIKDISVLIKQKAGKNTPRL